MPGGEPTLTLIRCRISRAPVPSQLWPVSSREQLRPYLGQLGFEIVGRVVDRQSIHTGTASIGLQPFPGSDPVLSCECLPSRSPSRSALRLAATMASADFFPVRTVVLSEVKQDLRR